MNIKNDLLFATQLVTRNAGFSTLCVFVIAVGLAVVLMLSTITLNFYGRSVSFPDGQSYVTLFGVTRTENSTTPRRVDSIDELVHNTIEGQADSYAFVSRAKINHEVTLSDGTTPILSLASLIDPDLLARTGVAPQHGRLLSEGDTELHADPVVLISDALWKSYLSMNEEVVGSHIRVNGEPHAIVGIMPEGFTFPFANELWLPASSSSLNEPGTNPATTVAILKNDVSLQSANDEISHLLSRLREQHKNDYNHFEVVALPYTRLTLPNDSPIALLMTIVSLLIGFLAVLNISNLMLVRTGERTHELGIRSALGARRGQIAQQALIETFLLSIGGLALGLLLTAAGNQLINEATTVVRKPFWMAFEIDTSIVLLAIFVVTLVWLIAGGIAAWRASRVDTLLTSGTTGVVKKGSSRVSNSTLR